MSKGNRNSSWVAVGTIIDVESGKKVGSVFGAFKLESKVSGLSIKVKFSIKVQSQRVAAKFHQFG